MKNTYLKPLVIIILLFPFLLNAQKELACGSYFKTKKTEIQPWEKSFTDRFGNIYSEKELIRSKKETSPNHCSVGIFNLDFSPDFTIEEEETICAAFGYLSTIVFLGPNGSSPIIEIQKEVFPINVGAAATPFYINKFCGRGESTIQEVMMTESPLDNNVAGRMFINSAILNWHTISEDPFMPPAPPNIGEFDLYSIALHEALHILGCASQILYTGEGYDGYYSPWDKFLYNSDIDDYLISSHTNNPNCCKTLDFNSTLTFPNDLEGGCGNNIFFRVNDINLAQVNLDIPLTMDPGIARNILSHLECSNNDPTIVLQDLDITESRRVLSDVEIKILEALGYIVDGGEGCKIVVTNDNYNYALGNEIQVSYVIANDELPNSYNFEINQTCGTAIANGAIVTEQNGSFVVENLPIGIFTVCYIISGCNDNCVEGFINIANYPQLPTCDNCDNGELFCYGSFEEFAPKNNFGINPELGYPTCFDENGYNSTPDVVSYDGNVFIALGGGINNWRENFQVPLTSPVPPGCGGTVCIDVVAAPNYCFQNVVPYLELLGTSADLCSNQGALDCNNNILNCIQKFDVPDCAPLGLPNQNQFTNHCFDYTNLSQETWDYLIVTRDVNEPNPIPGFVYIDNLSITSDCCEPNTEPPFKLCCNPEDNYACIMDENCEELLHEFCEGCWIEWTSPPEFNNNNPNNPFPGNIGECFSLDFVTQLGLPSSYVFEGIIHTYPGGIEELIQFSDQLDCEGDGTFSIGGENFSAPSNTNINAQISKIKIFPNPTKDEFKLTNSFDMGHQVEIISINGVTIDQFILNANSKQSFSTQQLINGIYYLKYTNLVTKEVTTEKLVVIK